MGEQPTAKFQLVSAPGDNQLPPPKPVGDSPDTIPDNQYVHIPVSFGSRSGTTCHGKPQSSSQTQVLLAFPTIIVLVAD